MTPTSPISSELSGYPWARPSRFKKTLGCGNLPVADSTASVAAHQSFNYALFDNAETTLLGCVYIDPPEKQGADAEICWWVVDEQVGTDLQRALDALVPQWIAAAWPFTRPRYIGRDLSWADWLALPDVDPPKGG